MRLSKRSPLQKIQRRAMRNAIDRVFSIYEGDSVRGDSPIEELLFTALVAEVDTGWHEHTEVLAPPRGEPLNADILGTLGQGALPLVVESQVSFMECRVDFLIWTIPTRRKKMLIVECDGHDFHERTKEQAAKDRSRDRKFQAAGHTVFRFTGSEIWRDPCQCADQILDWAVERSCFP